MILDFISLVRLNHIEGFVWEGCLFVYTSSLMDVEVFCAFYFISPSPPFSFPRQGLGRTENVDQAGIELIEIHLFPKCWD